jgi:hypothetical protein
MLRSLISGEPGERHPGRHGPLGHVALRRLITGTAAASVLIAAVGLSSPAAADAAG